MTASGEPVRLGLRANWQQFWLLVLINAFVGGMVGLERAIVPLLAADDFGQTSRTVILSFIVSFGIVKALANLFAGRMSDRIGRKRILVAGWVIGLPAPILVMLAPSWEWVVFANVLLGINQGLCWSTTVIMKIDLVGPARRGLAMGLNEFAGYGAVSLAALASGYLAATYALRPQPFYLGVIFAVAGRKGMIVAGMWGQAAGIVLVLVTYGFAPWALAMVLLGLGTALVYPTLLAAISDVAHPDWRASEVGVYRLWRDGGYAVGALLAGVLADLLGVPWAIGAIAALTFASGVVVLGRMYETLPTKRASVAFASPQAGAAPRPEALKART